MPYAVLLMAYGGPNSLGDIEAYLLDIRGGRKTPPEVVEEVRERYALIGGRSPLLDITRAQAQALEEHLNAGAAGPSYRIYVGMRHWYPYIHQAVAQIVEDGLRNVVALCMTPYYSQMSVGAYFQKLQEAQEALDVGAHSRAPLHVTSVESWHDHPLFIRAVTDKVKFALERFPTETRAQVKIVFTAHSLPAALMKQGDPYAAQLRETARLVAARLDLEADDWQLCYQSAGAHKVKWLGPQLKDVVTELAEDGHKRILVVPIGFVADNVEILYDIDIACRDLAAAQGVHLERTESLNTSPTFIQALADIVYQLTEHDNIQL